MLNSFSVNNHGISLNKFITNTKSNILPLSDRLVLEEIIVEPRSTIVSLFSETTTISGSLLTSGFVLGGFFGDGISTVAFKNSKRLSSSFFELEAATRLVGVSLDIEVFEDFRTVPLFGDIFKSDILGTYEEGDGLKLKCY